MSVEIGLCEMLHPVWYPEARDQHVEGAAQECVEGVDLDLVP